MLEFQKRWARAVVEADLAGVLELYAPEALLKPTLSDRLRKGRVEIGRYFEGFLKRGIGEVRFGDYNTYGAVVMGRYEFRGREVTPADYTFVVEGDLIVAHHSSLVFG